ncbi:dTMP kinase [Pseudomonas helleri]|uniref:dTMP kinase n=1 Tax=Pseudomonas helleri TaxID=1608996 RepID=UPI0021CA3AF0|nr:dTMP kinase [Pseudomonas helleri]MCU1755647.1 dTMP kinase [Pseudomonas helleri]
MKSKFIVFEGIDGSGTSTQSELLKKALNAKNIKCHLTCEPSDGPIGNMIRQIFKGRINVAKGSNPNIDSGNLFDEQMAYLFAADRHDHLYNNIDGVFKLKAEGAVVISTRYYFSSFAYHCSNQEDFNLVKTLNARFPDPDLVIYLDNPAKKSIERINERSFKDEYENTEKLLTAKNNYEKIFQEYKGRILKIDATGSIESIHKKILLTVDALIEN